MEIQAYIKLLLIACVFALTVATPASAGSLSVTPVLIDVASPNATSSITIRNQGEEPINVQIRIFRWTQDNGQDQFVATTDVVASPPFTTLAAGAENLIRVVRVANTAAREEESYRLIIDQLPDTQTSAGAGVNLLLRHSIPVFFGDTNFQPIPLDWSYQQIGQNSRIIVRNQSARRIRLSNLQVTSSSGDSLSYGSGLLGYVLAHATMQWFSTKAISGAQTNGQVRISVQSDRGPLEQNAHVFAPQ